MKKQSQWTVIATERFNLWLLEQTEDVRQSVFASLNNLKMYGYQLSRPYADTIKGSKYQNFAFSIKASRCERFLLSTHLDKLLCSVRGIKVTTNNFMSE